MEQRHIDRFFANISPEALTGCWLWTAYVDKFGYGQLNINGKPTPAHRVSAMIHGLDMSGPVMRHMCNNPSCVNPAHLQTGTYQDNTNDMLLMNRQFHPIGSASSGAKLTEQDVISLRNAYACGSSSIKELAILYNISTVQVNAIIKRKYWKHV